MSFYGNINNLTNTQFQFDKIYPNRKAMDDSLVNPTNEDDIYIGRYVLVEYGSEYREDSYKPFYFSGGALYTSPNKEILSKVTTKNAALVNNEIIRVPIGWNLDTNNINVEFYAVTIDHETISLNRIYLEDNNIENSPFWINYKTDLQFYFNTGGEKIRGRGYDSTVWQKVYDNNSERYIMVAELNTQPPTFDICPDAPTLTPVTPHFDSDSANTYYKLHVQPHWGMWVKHANGEYSSDTANLLSDEMVDYEKSTYNILTDKITVSRWKEPGAIYYNKAGFDKSTRSFKDLDNKIALQPTGRSGDLYYNHESNEMQPANDVQELIVQLPAIGNAVSDLWDIVYGEERNLDMDWGSTDGIRYLTVDENGYHVPTEENLATVAGVVNSMHDLMGMIIEEPEGGVEPKDLQDGIIYYQNKKFYRRAKSYTYHEDEVEYADPEYVKVDLTEASYIPDVYYIEENGVKKPDTAKEFDSTKTYYQREIVPGAKVSIPLILDYEKNKYYLYDSSQFTYTLETAQKITPGKTGYYRLSNIVENIELHNAYHPNVYYLQDADGNYILSRTNIPELEYNQYHMVTSKTEVGYFYVPGKYSYVSNGEVLIDDSTNMKSGRQYYTLEEDDDNNVILTKIELKDFRPNCFIETEDGDYYIIKTKEDIPEEPTIHYTMEFEAVPHPFYESKKYYYKTEDGEGHSYIFATDTNFDAEKNYCTLESEKISYFYEPDTYWYWDSVNRVWVLDPSATMSQKENEYYYEETYYVIKDDLGLLDKGAQWNNNVTMVPHTITLGKRKEIYVLKELESFAKAYNTLHGLILKINHLLEAEDELTRDTKTFQGTLNLFNDYINKIGNLMPGDITVVDNYGRIQAALTTGDDWISADINPDVKRPKINLRHKTSLANAITVGDNKNNSSTIKVPMIKVDKGGHIVEVKDNEVAFSSMTKEALNQIGYPYVTGAGELDADSVGSIQWLFAKVADLEARINQLHP